MLDEVLEKTIDATAAKTAAGLRLRVAVATSDGEKRRSAFRPAEMFSCL